MNESSRHQTVQFAVAPEVLDLGVQVAVIAAGGLRNRKTDEGFEQIKRQSIAKILTELAHTPIARDPVLQGFRELHTALGFSNRNFPAASESLLEYVLKNHDLPRINLLVDIYNLVSVETRFSLGAHDLARVSGNIHLRLTTGAEKFHPLGSPEPKPVRPGAYAYIDDDNEVICLLEVKQVEKTKATLETSECFFIVQGNPRTGPAQLQAAVDRLSALLVQFCGGQIRYL
jgi:DNA/RNA-binding domain of Phe-tRNA-synthetase-like protein